MRIEEWSVIGGEQSPYIAPEAQVPSLYGRVFGHPRFPDGTWVTTSAIVGKNNKDEIVTRSGNSYGLGFPDLYYETKFPGARGRLLAGLGN